MPVIDETLARLITPLVTPEIVFKSAASASPEARVINIHVWTPTIAVEGP